MPDKPPGFCIFLRKKLKNARIVSITQKESERIIEIFFRLKDHNLRLYIELFSKGNIILCDEQNIIIGSLNIQKWKDRTVRHKQEYTYPKKEFNFITIDENELNKLLDSTNKESIVKSLAIDLGLGGTYAEEICLIAGVDKNNKPKDTSSKKIFKALDNIRTAERSANTILDGNTVKNIVPINLKTLSDFKSEHKESFNEAIDEELSKEIEAAPMEEEKSKADSTIKKTNLIINEQLNRIKGLEIAEVENKRKGELIYEHYQEIESFLERFNKELEKKTPDQELFKKVKFNKKTKEVTIEV